MGHLRRLKTATFLLAFSTLALASGTGYAHDGSAHATKGLSEAARQASASPAGAGPVESFSGWFHILYGDAPPGSGVPAISGYALIDDQGQAIELLLDEQTLRVLGGARALNHRRVISTGQKAVTSAAGMRAALPLLVVQALQHEGPQPAPAAVTAAQAVTGPQPWATVLCRFSDFAGVTPHPVSWFNTLILGTTPPGLDHYWRELSFNNVNITGSAVYGWYTLPQPRSYYVHGTPAQLDFQRATNDCTAVADADVYFPGFVGINLMFNTDLDGFAWGGSWTVARDGQTKTYRVTWVPPWGYNNQGPIAHEMGHGFGLPHSSGPYSATYDSRWDVMSDIWDNCPPYDPTYGCVGPHTISYHKDILGWIPSAQKYVAAPGTSQIITMERLGQPTSGNYLMAQLPIGGSGTQFYTVEARRFAGYDTKLPGEAVVMHRVDTTRSDREAQVVDPDGNGNPDDAGAMWVTSETFVDPANGLTVSVLSQTATGFQVSISTGIPVLTVASTNPGSGVGVTVNPADTGGLGSGMTPFNRSYGFNTSVNVTAPATASGKAFQKWQRDGVDVSTSPTIQVAMNADHTMTAVYGTSSAGGSLVFTVTNTSNSAAVAGSLPWAVQQANSNPGLDYIYFNIPGPGVHVITLSTTLFLNDQVVIDGKTQPGYAGSPLVYVWGTSSVTSLFLLQNASSGSTVQGLGLYGYTSNAVTVFSSSIGNWIQDNYMGFYADGVSPVLLNSSLFPLTRGIGLQSGFNTIRGNTISGVDNAIVIGEDPAQTWSGTVYKTNSIQGNRIGTNPAGDSAAGFGNTGDGIFVGAGGRENFLGPNNVLSGNASSGVELFHPSVIGNVVFRNAIGVNAAATAAIPNHELGVLLTNGANGNAVGGPFGGNVISANTLGGVSLGTALSAPFTSAANGNWVQYNIIGLNLSQSAAPGAQDVGVAISNGSMQNDVEGNVLAGNVHHGAQLFDVVTNSVSNNWIGMSSSGVARANGGFGVYLHNASNNFATGNAFGVNTLGAVGADGTSCCNVTN